MVKKKRRKYGLSTHSFNCTRFPFPTSIVFKKRRNRRLSGSQSRNHLHPLPGINLKQPFSKRVPLPGTEWSTTGIAYSASCTRVVKYRLQQDIQSMIRMKGLSKNAYFYGSHYDLQPTSSAPSKSLQFATRRHLPKFAESKHGVGTCFIERVEFAWIIFSTLIL